MMMRNWIELGLLLVMAAGGVASKLILRRRLADIDGLGPISKREDGISPEIVIETQPVKVTEEE